MPAANKTTPTMDGVALGAEVAMDTTDGVTVSGCSTRTVIIVRNADAVNPHDVTFVTSYEVAGLALEDRVATIPANGTRYFSQFDPKYYGRTMTINADSTDIKVQAIQV